MQPNRPSVSRRLSFSPPGAVKAVRASYTSRPASRPTESAASNQTALVSREHERAKQGVLRGPAAAPVTGQPQRPHGTHAVRAAQAPTAPTSVQGPAAPPPPPPPPPPPLSAGYGNSNLDFLHKKLNDVCLTNAALHRKLVLITDQRNAARGQVDKASKVTTQLREENSMLKGRVAAAERGEGGRVRELAMECSKLRAALQNLQAFEAAVKSHFNTSYEIVWLNGQRTISFLAM